MIALASMYRTLLTQRAALAAPPLTPWPSVNTAIAARPVATVPATATAPAGPAPSPSLLVPTDDSCSRHVGGCGGSSPAPALPAAVAPSFSSVQLPAPAGSNLVADAEAAPDPKAVGAALKQNGGLLLWLVIALIVVAVMAGHGGGGRRSSW